MLNKQSYNNYHIYWIYLNCQIVEIVVEYYQMDDCDQDRSTYYPREHDGKFTLFKITFLGNFKFKDQIVKQLLLIKIIIKAIKIKWLQK